MFGIWDTWGNLNKLEGVQRRWTKQIDGLSNFSYGERLRKLKLYSVQGRLFRADLIKTWKAFHSDVDVGLAQLFDRRVHQSTRGHQYKISVPLCNLEVRRRFLSVRVVYAWNSLPQDVVALESLDAFKGKLDMLLSDQFYMVR